MRQKSGPEKQPADDAIRDIRRAIRRHFAAEEKILHLVGGAARAVSPASSLLLAPRNSFDQP
jgi:hypothetical protein